MHLFRMLFGIKPADLPKPPPESPQPGHPYREPCKKEEIEPPLAEPRTSVEEVITKYAYLFEPKDDLLWIEWVKLHPYQDTGDMLRYFLSRKDVRPGFQARIILAAVTEEASEHIYLGERLGLHKYLKLKGVPPALKQFTIDLALAASITENDNTDARLDDLLSEIAETSTADAPEAIQRLSSAGMWRYLRLLANDSEIDPSVRQCADNRLRGIVKVELSLGHCNQLHYDCVVREYAHCFYMLDAPWLRERVEFLASIGAPVFCTGSIQPVLERLFAAPEDRDMRVRILELYRVHENVSWFEVKPEWIEELEAAGKHEIAESIRKDLRERKEQRERHRLYDEKQAQLRSSLEELMK